MLKSFAEKWQIPVNKYLEGIIARYVYTPELAEKYLKEYIPELLCISPHDFTDKEIDYKKIQQKDIGDYIYELPEDIVKELAITAEAENITPAQLALYIIINEVCSSSVADYLRCITDPAYHDKFVNKHKFSLTF